MTTVGDWSGDLAQDLVVAGQACVPVLLTGGTAATRLAAAYRVHELGGLVGPFVRVDSAALPAVTRPCTVYFEEIANLGLVEQRDMMRWLDEHVDSRRGLARLITATGDSVVDAVSSGRFDARLFYRLNVIHVRLR